jgi:hypothetical protein
MGSDLVYSILSPEWNADKTRVDKVRYWTAVARLFRGIDLCRSESMEAGSTGLSSSHNILTLDALQVLSRSQVTLGCQCPCGYGRYVKSTYIHSSELAWQRRVAHPFFHQSILWITTACMHGSAGIAHLPPNSVDHDSSLHA